MLFGWASSDLDYTLLAKGLKLAGRQDVLPPEPVPGSQPFWWWATLRQSLGATADEMSLCLSRVYGSLYPEDRRLLLQAHAGTPTNPSNGYQALSLYTGTTSYIILC